MENGKYILQTKQHEEPFTDNPDWQADFTLAKHLADDFAGPNRRARVLDADTRQVLHDTAGTTVGQYDTVKGITILQYAADSFAVTWETERGTWQQAGRFPVAGRVKERYLAHLTHINPAAVVETYMVR
jgi:hypothetical protein